VNVNKSKVAIETYATDLPASRLTARQVKLRSAYLQMCTILRGEDYAYVTHVLPHFQVMNTTKSNHSMILLI